MTPDPETLARWREFDNDVAKHSYRKRIALIVTQAINVIFLNGSQDQTTSGHIAKKIHEGTDKWYHRLLCGFLRTFERSHCWISRKE